mgnify:CR=1 FL=1
MKVKRGLIFISILIIISLPVYFFSIGSENNSNEETLNENSSGIITPVYVTINSHNENNWNINSKNRYFAYRKDLLERLQLIQEYNAKLNWGSDYVVLLAMKKYETEEILEDTNNKNILQYIIEDFGFSVDPHLHPSEYNYADIAYLIEQMDVKSSSVIGGVIVKDCINGEQVFTNWHDTLELQNNGYIYGKIYPNYKWKPEILSGAGSTSHVYDDLSSGIWYPGNNEDFYEDQGKGIVLIGQGYDHDATLVLESNKKELYYEDGAYIKELVEKIKSGELPSEKMYTANIHIQDKEDISNEVKTNDALKQVLEELKPYADAGLIKYVTYQESLEIWKEEYNSEPNKVDISEFSKYDQILAQQEKFC